MKSWFSLSNPVSQTRVVGVFLCACLLSAIHVLAISSSIELVSMNGAQTGSGNRESMSQVISLDGRYIAFASNADDLVAGDRNAASDVFLRDLQTGTTQLVSINMDGTGSANGASSSPSISDNGRYVAFVSNAGNMVTNDQNNVDDVYVRDMLLGSTTLASASYLHGAAGNNNANAGKISANGRTVVFSSNAFDLTPNDTNGLQDVFVRDLNLSLTRMVSLNYTGTASANNSSNLSAISLDGRYVMFASPANNLVPNDTNTVYDVFVRDMDSGVTSLISVNNAGTASGNNGSFATNLTPDGRYALFYSIAEDLVSNDGNGRQDTFVRDLINGTTLLVSVTPAGISGNGGSGAGVITPDGRYVVFVSVATNLVPNGFGTFNNVFERDLQTGTTMLVSVNSTGVGGGNNHSSGPAVSLDGRYVAFGSSATNIVATNDFNGSNYDVFVRDMHTQTTRLVSVNMAGTGTGNSSSLGPLIGADGHYVVFSSNSNDLIINDINGVFSDVFVVDVQQTPLTDQLRFSTPIYNVSESGGFATITVNRAPGITGAITTTYSTGPGTATAGSDYTPVTGTLNFAAGDNSKSFTVPVLEDSIYEATEIVSLSLTGNVSRAVVLIQDNDLQPVLTVNDISIIEGNSGVSFARFVITQTPVSEQRTSVGFGTSPDTAAQWEDYSPTYGTAYIEPGQSSTTVDVPIFGDLMFEPDERFYLFISSPVNATIGDDRGVCTILNDDSDLVYVSVEDVAVTEGNPELVNAGFRVTFSAPSALQMAFSFITIPGTATQDVDYTWISGARIVQPGTTTMIVGIPIHGDLLDEPDETFKLRISSPQNCIIVRNEATATIIDDDPEPAISISDVRVTEARSGTYAAIFTANLSAPSGKTVTVDYATADGTASAGEDYQPIGGTMTFNPGQSIKQVAVQVNSDALSEGDETFFLNLSNSTNASLARAQGMCTITDYRVRVAADFDGDGKSDISVFRPSEGTWYITNSSNGNFLANQFGMLGDRIVPADYDGDGKVDVAVFRRSTSTWYRLDSSTGAFHYVTFGQTGDIPAAGDYDGDGKADVTVYRPSTGVYYFLRSTDGTFQFFQWGQAGDIPVIGDYNVDGKSDLAVFRPSAGTFYILMSETGSVRSQQWGMAGDIPIAGDFDGDASTDIAVYRPSTASWYYLQSSDNTYRGLAWGTSGDIPVAGEYDGDSKWDIAVFRPSNGLFYIFQSATNTLRAEPFGISIDIPVASAMLP